MKESLGVDNLGTLGKIRAVAQGYFVACVGSTIEMVLEAR